MTKPCPSSFSFIELQVEAGDCPSPVLLTKSLPTGLHQFKVARINMEFQFDWIARDTVFSRPYEAG